MKTIGEEVGKVNKELKKTGRGCHLNGRPKGVKNKTTLFKEAMQEGFENRLKLDGLKVFNAVVQKAIGPPSRGEDGELLVDENGKQMYIDGDSTAQKMLMDRLIPVADITKNSDVGKFSISINVQGMETNITTMDDKPIDADFEEI